MYYLRFIASSKCIVEIYMQCDEESAKVQDLYAKSCTLHNLFMNFLKNKLVIENPDYLEAVKYNFSLYGKPKTISLYQDLGITSVDETISVNCFNKTINALFAYKHTYVMPAGAMYELFSVFKNKNLLSFCDFKNTINYSRPLESNAKLYNTRFIQSMCKIFHLFDYQQKAVLFALTKKGGVIVAPCGSGKTRIGLVSSLIYYLIFGGKIIWLTHTKTLLEQTKLAYERLMEDLYNVLKIDDEKLRIEYNLLQDEVSILRTHFDFSQNAIGVVAEGKINIGSIITFSLVQTLSKKSIDNTFLNNSFSVCVVDEAHHCVGSLNKLNQFYACVNTINCRFKLGLTATPERQDNLTSSMFYAFLGNNVVYKIDKNCVNNSNLKCKSVKLTYHLTSRERELITDASGQIDTQRYMRVIGASSNRLKLVCDEIEKLLNLGHNIIFVARTVDVVVKVYEYFVKKYIQKNVNQYGKLSKSLVITNEKLLNKNEGDNVGDAFSVSNKYIFKEQKVLIGKLTGGIDKRLRQDLIKTINDKDIVNDLRGMLICSTQQIVVEGFDVACLDVAFAWQKSKNKTIQTQLQGRVERAFLGKTSCYYYSIVDKMM